MQRPHFARLLRTPSSERYALQNDAGDFASLDLHYLPDATVQGTLVLFEGAGIIEEDVADLLHHIDEVLLPEVRLDQRNLTFTVVVGRVLGAFTAEQDEVTVS
jgi:hypothetical protein